MSHLIKDRYGTYYTRQVVPPPLRPFMQEPWRGKSEWKRTLGAKDPKEAKRVHIGMLAWMDAAFAVAEPKADGTVTSRRIDLDKRGCFVLEAKQSRQVKGGDKELHAGPNPKATPQTRDRRGAEPFRALPSRS